MDPEELSSVYPFLYHMAEIGSWPGIRKYGLRSTSALLDLYDVRDGDRLKIEGCRRSEAVTISRTGLPSATIRDNRPLADSKLEKALAGTMPISDWYRLLNGKVFFWLTVERLVKLLSASNYANRTHIVLKVPTQDLLARTDLSVWLSPMNSGSTSPFGHPRGPDTFKRITEFPFDERRRTRRLEDTVVELAVDGLIDDIGRLVESVTVWQGDRQSADVWHRPDSA